MVYLVLVIGGCFTFTNAKSSQVLSQSLRGCTYESPLQANTIWFNDTDYNSTAAFKQPGLGTVTGNVTPRMVIEYGDYAIQQSMSAPAGLPAIFPTRIFIEYADASFLISLQRPGNLNQTVGPRIMIEYADYAIIFRLRYAYDINDDGKVDMKDVGVAARGFGSSPGSPKWNMIADINGDAKIDMKDIGAIALHYGEHYQ